MPSFKDILLLLDTLTDVSTSSDTDLTLLALLDQIRMQEPVSMHRMNGIEQVWNRGE